MAGYANMSTAENGRLNAAPAGAVASEELKNQTSKNKSVGRLLSIKPVVAAKHKVAASGAQLSSLQGLAKWEMKRKNVCQQFKVTSLSWCFKQRN